MLINYSHFVRPPSFQPIHSRARCATAASNRSRLRQQSSDKWHGGDRQGQDPAKFLSMARPKSSGSCLQRRKSSGTVSVSNFVDDSPYPVRRRTSIVEQPNSEYEVVDIKHTGHLLLESWKNRLLPVPLQSCNQPPPPVINQRCPTKSPVRDISPPSHGQVTIIMERLRKSEPKTHASPKQERLFKLSRKRTGSRQRTQLTSLLKSSKLPLPVELAGWSILTSKEEI